MSNHKIHLFAIGTNGGLTLASFGELLHQVNWQNALTVLFGALTTGVSWYVSARQAKREQDRLDREEARHQRLEDVLQEIRLTPAPRLGQVPVGAAGPVGTGPVGCGPVVGAGVVPGPVTGVAGPGVLPPCDGTTVGPVAGSVEGVVASS